MGAETERPELARPFRLDRAFADTDSSGASGLEARWRFSLGCGVEGPSSDAPGTNSVLACVGFSAKLRTGVTGWPDVGSNGTRSGATYVSQRLTFTEKTHHPSCARVLRVGQAMVRLVRVLELRASVETQQRRRKSLPSKGIKTPR